MVINKALVVFLMSCSYDKTATVDAYSRIVQADVWRRCLLFSVDIIVVHILNSVLFTRFSVASMRLIHFVHRICLLSFCCKLIGKQG